MTRVCYRVTATLCDGWWAVAVVDLPGGYTTAGSLDDVEPRARALVADLLCVPSDSFDVDLSFAPTVVPEQRRPRSRPAHLMPPAPPPVV